MKGLTEAIQRILIHHEIATSVRPHPNIRRILVHPKDKVEDSKNKVYHIFTIFVVRAVTTHVSANRENIWNKTRRTQEEG